MGTLYIIGNGFDLNLNLKTKPKHFLDCLKKQLVYGEVDNAFEVLGYYVDGWHEYEQALNRLDLNEIESRNEIQPDYLSDHESDRDCGILNMQMYVDGLSTALNGALEQMVKNANNDIRRLKAISGKRKLFHKSDAILTFNYTSAIEHLFFIPPNVPIFHVHGCYESGERLIFGYKENENSYDRSWPSVDENNWDYYIAQQRNAVYAFYEHWRKPLQIDQLRKFLLECHSITNVIVLGHSMGSVDAEYMEEIEKEICPRTWRISYYKTNDIEHIRSMGYTFASKISFETMEALMEADHDGKSID